MPEFRRDPITGRWVIISPERGQRPNDFQTECATTSAAGTCPFCTGREAMTPPEVLAVPTEGRAADTPGWRLRVVPNKYPALLRTGGSGDGEVEAGHVGPGERIDGVGIHEVIIETPHHDRPLSAMSDREVELVLWAYRERMLAARQDATVRFVLIFKNHGAAAGATLEHPHSQLLALPLVPDPVRDEIARSTAHHRSTGRCLACDVIQDEVRGASRIVHVDGDVIACAPYAARFPYETWLLPRTHGARFEAASPATCTSLARVLRRVLATMRTVLGNPAFNLVVHTAPFEDALDPVCHWRIEVLPKLTRTAGFEWGTGCFINPTPPERAAAVLRGA